MAIFPADRALQLQLEEQLLVKADEDIEQGWTRLRHQEELLAYLEAAGHDTRQAERLIGLLKQTLSEWERHRSLIEERIDFLRKEVYPVPPVTG